jgi:hypothetical protein
VPGAFYEQLSPGTFSATGATAGPWWPDAQHGGPPSALLARELEQAGHAGPGLRLARVAIDILRPVPVAKVTVRTRLVRGGRRVSLAEAVLECDGQQVLHGRGWWIAEPPGGVPPLLPAGTPPPLPPASQAREKFPGAAPGGYLDAIEWRFTSGGFGHAGPSAAWARPRLPLIEGEHVSPMARTLLVADSGSGVGSALDPSQFLFVNVDLTVVLPRYPDGQWILLDPDTAIGGTGTGLTTTKLSDQAGEFGIAAQTLLVSPR